MRLTIETEREDDGRWIAEVKEFSGVMGYGKSLEDATKRVKELARRIVSERMNQSEPTARMNAG